MSKDEKSPYDEFHTHEVLHIAHVLADTWHEHIISTRCVDEFPDIKKAAEKVAKAMYEFYQLVGSKRK